MNEKMEFSQRLIDAYLQLPAPQRKVVREVVLALAQVQRSDKD